MQADATEALNYLTQVESKTRRQIIRKSVRRGANVILPEARALCPELTGKMKRNIKVRSGSRSTKTAIAFSVGVSDKDFTGPAWYAVWVIFPHRYGKRPSKKERKEKGDARSTSYAGNDFLDLAFANTKAAAEQTIEDTIVDEVTKIA